MDFTTNQTRIQSQTNDMRSAAERIPLQTRMYGEESAKTIITTYLTERVGFVKRLVHQSALKALVAIAYSRIKGWSNPEGDDFFARQRAAADAPGLEGARKFYVMTQNIGIELQAYTQAFTVSALRQNNPHFLDTGAAPGRFLYTAMHCNHGSQQTNFV